MKPNPLSSLNHLTVPVGMWEFLHGMCVLLRGGCCLELRPASACTAFAGLMCRPDRTTVAGPGGHVLSRCCIRAIGGSAAPGAVAQARVVRWASQPTQTPGPRP